MATAIEVTDENGTADRCREIAADAPPWTETQRAMLAAMMAERLRMAS